MNALNRYTPVRERIEHRLCRADGANGCWIWTGHVQGTRRDENKRRPRISVGGVGKRVHRVLYELDVAPIPPGKDLLHECGNSRCVRPSHMYVGTDIENARDRIRHGTVAAGERNGLVKMKREIERLRAELEVERAEVRRLRGEVVFWEEATRDHYPGDARSTDAACADLAHVNPMLLGPAPTKDAPNA